MSKVQNVFTGLKLSETHRSAMFQEGRFQDEVPALKNRTQFPYACLQTNGAEMVALVVFKGKPVNFYSRTGAVLQNLENLLELAKGLKGDGVYFGTFSSPLAPKNLAKLYSAFRKTKVTAPQRITLDAETKFLIDDYVTVEEFSAGTALLKYRKRLDRLAKVAKKVFKKQSIFFPAPTPAFIDTQAELEAYVTEANCTVLVRGDNPWASGHKNFHYMKKAPMLTGEFKCTGHVLDTKGNLQLSFEYAEGKTFMAKGSIVDVPVLADALKKSTDNVVGKTLTVKYCEVGAGNKPMVAQLVEMEATKSKPKKDKKAKKVKDDKPKKKIDEKKSKDKKVKTKKSKKKTK